MSNAELRAPNLVAPGNDTARATVWGVLAAAAVVVGVVVGSRGLKDFDAALVAYAGASVFAAFGLGYRYAMWLRRPPTRLYWRRGWQLFLQPRRIVHNLLVLPKLAWNNLVAQTFLEKRSRLRWVAHLCIAWGCILAAAVTFPLSFGWIRFESSRESQDVYQAFVFGLPIFRFPIHGPLAPLVFNVLDVAAILVLTGIALAMWRRTRDRGALALQQPANDLWPLILLFAVSITGIFLTLSTHVMRGVHYAFLSELHAVTVIFTLLYLPFGKFFHVFQRPAQLSIKFYKEEGARRGQAKCIRCGGEYGTSLHVGDLKRIQAALAIRYQTETAHYQDVCPGCRRRMLAIAQDGLWRAARAEKD